MISVLKIKFFVVYGPFENHTTSWFMKFRVPPNGTYDKTVFSKEK